MRFDTVDLLAHVFFEVIEGVEVGGFAGHRAHLLGEFRAQLTFLHFQQPTIGVVDDDELLGVEQVMGDDERAQRVFGGDAAGVADHVRVARFQSQTMLEQDAGVHAGQHRYMALGADGEFSQLEVAREFFVGF